MTDSTMSSAKKYWLEFALKVLIKKGPERLKIQSLCDEKGVSKGSFYHHFTNRSVFIDNLMTFWYEQTTTKFIMLANTKRSAIEKLEKLDAVIASQNIEAEIHIRAWALTEPIIIPHLEKIDLQRQAFLADCYVELGFDENESEDYATMAYANFIGMLHIYPSPSKERALKISAMGMKALLSMDN